MFTDLIQNRFFQVTTFIAATALIIFGFNYNSNDSEVESLSETASVTSKEIEVEQVSNDQTNHSEENTEKVESTESVEENTTSDHSDKE